MKLQVVVLVLLASCACQAALVDFEAIGGIPDDSSFETAVLNRELFNITLNNLAPGTTLLIPNRTYIMLGGVVASGLKNITFQIEGTIRFTNDRSTWPTYENGTVYECILLQDIEDIVFTSSGVGTIDGNGKGWWGALLYLIYSNAGGSLYGENRPRLVHIIGSKNVIWENLLLKDSPFWSFYAENCDGMIIRYSNVSARWTDQYAHTLLDIQAFNTDGFDVTGKNVHLHDCNIWNNDDCISVKDGAVDMLFERVSCSGVGLVIGSIGSSRVNNITFRDSVLPKTIKGIYMKTRWYDDAPIGEEASISNILFENITMYSPQQYSIWIGPAQQDGQPCSLLWPTLKGEKCRISGYQTWSNITLRNIFIHDPLNGPGVLLSNTSNPVKNLVFENVVVMNQGSAPFGENYYCEGLEVHADEATTPAPPCLASKKVSIEDLSGQANDFLGHQ